MSTTNWVLNDIAGYTQKPSTLYVFPVSWQYRLDGIKINKCCYNATINYRVSLLCTISAIRYCRRMFCKFKLPPRINAYRLFRSDARLTALWVRESWLCWTPTHGRIVVHAECDSANQCLTIRSLPVWLTFYTNILPELVKAIAGKLHYSRSVNVERPTSPILHGRSSPLSFLLILLLCWMMSAI